MKGLAFRIGADSAGYFSETVENDVVVDMDGPHTDAQVAFQVLSRMLARRGSIPGNGWRSIADDPPPNGRVLTWTPLPYEGMSNVLISRWREGKLFTVGDGMFAFDLPAENRPTHWQHLPGGLLGVY